MKRLGCKLKFVDQGLFYSFGFYGIPTQWCHLQGWLDTKVVVFNMCVNFGFC